MENFQDTAPKQSFFERADYVYVNPISTLVPQGGTITYLFPRSSEYMLDLSKCTLEAYLRILRPDKTPVGSFADDPVTVSNLALDAFIAKVR